MEQPRIRYYNFDDFRVDVKRRTLFKNGQQIPLTGRNFDLLLVMVQSDGHILEHEELLEKVWGETFVEQANLKKGISSLRQALGEKPNESLYIKTIPRRGYSFVAEVTAENDDSGLFLATEAKPEIVAEASLPDKVELPAHKSVEEVSEELPPVALHASSGFPRKYKVLALVAVSLLVGVTLIFGIRQFSGGNAVAETFRLGNLKIRKMTTSGNVVDKAISPDGKTIVYATVGENKQQTLWAKRIGAPNPLQIVPPTNVEYEAISISPDNNQVFYCVAVANSSDLVYSVSISGGSSRKITENISSAITFSPDGSRIAFVRDIGNASRVLITANAADGSDEREIRKVSDNHTMISPVWSPDGKKMAFVSSNLTDKGRIWRIVEIPADGGEPQEIVAARPGKIHIFDWSRDGKGLVICADPNDSLQSQLWYASYPNGEMSRLTNDILTYEGINLSADSNAVLTIQKERTGDLWYLNYSLLQNTERLTDTQAFTGRFTVSPDNRILSEVTENGRRGLAFINADGSGFQPLFPQTANEQSPAVSRDGRTIYFVSTRSGTSEIWQSDIEGRNAKKLTDEKTFIIILKPTPDEKTLYFGMYDGIRWRLARMPIEGGKPSFVFEETLGAFDLSPDGNLLAYSFFDSQNKKWKIAVRSVADNSIVKEFDGAAFDYVSWTPDGKNLIYTLPTVSREGGSLWLQPVAGGSSKLLLEAKDDKFLWGSWSPDGQKLYFTKGKTVSNIVMLTKETGN